MKYFIDTEFIESFHKPLFGKRRHFIDLISIGIVAEDGREYSAISNEYKYSDASPWVRANVIDVLYARTVPAGAKYQKLYTESNFHKEFGKSNRDIAKDIFLFVNPNINPWEYWEFCRRNDIFQDPQKYIPGPIPVSQPEFYGYYCDYDWVLLCSLFGTMMELPRGFPMYCRDLKQMLDQMVVYIMQQRNIPADKQLGLFDTYLERLQANPLYPIESGNHLAINDARWNKKLEHFLMQYILDK